MSENNNNRYSREENEREYNKNGEQRSTENSGESYYYSYGPFQSINSDGREDRSNEVNEVEVTPPDPVKPIPTMLERNSNGFTRSSASSSGNAENGQNGANGGSGNRNWNYNHNNKPKSNFKTGAVSFIAGMVVISLLMFTADRMNLFTPDAALSTSATAQTSDSGSTNTGNSGVTTSLAVGSTDISSVVSKVSPAVVKIETLSKSSSSNSSRNNSYYNDPLYQYFFGGNGYNGSNNNNNNNSNNGSSEDQLVPLGIGSGFIFEKDGYILTNEHVISGADVIQVTLEDNTKPYEATLLGSSKDLDLAVLKIEGDTDFPVATLGDSDSTKVGDWLVAIGNPEGFEHTVTAGVLSAKDRTISITDEDTGEANEYNNLLQTDASINPGNSGGPLLNLNGEVIGMNVAVSADAQGIGFAIPSSVIKEVVDKLKNNEEIPKEPVPFIGASLMNLTSEVAKQMGTDLTEGSVVTNLIYQSPAYTADLRPYDIITGIDGTKYATAQDLIEAIQSKNVGDKITLNVNRDGKDIDIQVTIGNKNDFETESSSTQSTQP